MITVYLYCLAACVTGVALYFTGALLRKRIRVLAAALMFYGIGLGFMGGLAFVAFGLIDLVVVGFKIPASSDDSVVFPTQESQTPFLQTKFDSTTGCQYLVAPNGSLTPKVDSTGKQICRKTQR